MGGVRRFSGERAGLRLKKVAPCPAGRYGTRGNGINDLLGQHVHRYGIGLRERDGMFQGILKLTHVARP